MPGDVVHVEPISAAGKGIGHVDQWNLEDFNSLRFKVPCVTESKQLLMMSTIFPIPELDEKQEKTSLRLAAETVIELTLAGSFP